MTLGDGNGYRSVGSIDDYFSDFLACGQKYHCCECGEEDSFHLVSLLLMVAIF